jgi:NAD(P)-dependent dehydrogenase (short-subunit alcohol dehydrogenase family)
MSSDWNPTSLPPQDGRTFAVTGGNAGIGYFITEQLAATGAKVVILGRNPERVDAAIRSVRSRLPSADVESILLDLADLASVREAALELADLGRLDGLVENAGVISAGRRRRVTADGLELTFGTNHLGHFALTAGVLPQLAATPDSRIVTMGSVVAGLTRYSNQDLLSEKHYFPFRAYSLSKHATEMFGFELDRRLDAAGSATRALVAHPGGGLEGATPGREGVVEPSRTLRARDSLAVALRLGQGKDRAAWPAVRALIDPDARGGQYYGPEHRTFGAPMPVEPTPSSLNRLLAEDLWRRSQDLLGITFDV